MAEETISTINSSTDIEHLIFVENNMNYFISQLENKNNIKGSLANRLISEANEYGVPSLDEYIKFKLKYYHSLKEACVNRLIELNLLNSNTTRRSGTSSIAV